MKGKSVVNIDVVALGMKAERQESYSKLAASSGGIFLALGVSSELQSSTTNYVQSLNLPRLEPVRVVGKRMAYTVFPGEELSLVPGNYSILLPSDGSEPSKRLLKNVKINSGEHRVIDLTADE
jgi:hypothetical protein